MLSVRIDSRQFQREINNIMEYSAGFLDGIQKGKIELYASLAPKISELASQFIDVNARMSPELLHHIYEWEKVGSPQARLFDLDYKISNIGITFTSSLKQSTSIKNGSNVPFYDKARIMEDGVSVTIEPKRANALRFEIDGTEVYTSSPVTVDNPGGKTKGQFENIVDKFFGVYFRQSFLNSSGLLQYFNTPQVYKKNLASAKRGGRALGLKTGYRWVADAGKVG
ncbi:MAG: hypothetical protein AN484_01270 [Aphanizomenon flos-aquae WA102]|jgi:hypothetical protein|uniref:Uncharacterized protein n=1 Tax=Aphanizomenon flos-aquae WA102 TaxID=1710896 RepID=A0A1B7X8E4_APHFL|nr:MAG: hypothetical protein AN484_01270 [Aphanizomenon flos-aquae WA102]